MGILEILLVVMLVAWLLGVGTLGVMAGGGLIHLLLLVLVVLVIVKLSRGERL